MFRLFPGTIAVAFIDDATGRQFAVSKVSVNQLPDTFALATEMELAGSRYVVVRAEPQTKTEFATTKRLTLRLRRLEQLDPKTVLFSLPSVCGTALPRTSGTAASADVLVLHEDDWRQCEFVAVDQSQDIATELSGIRRIHAQDAAAVGWSNVHVRERIIRPLPVGATWSSVADRLGPCERIGGVAFGQAANSVANAVGARLPEDVVVWGVEEGGELCVLCVENLDGASASTIAALKRIADGLSLALIHWCRCQVYCRDFAIDHAAGAIWESDE